MAGAAPGTIPGNLTAPPDMQTTQSGEARASSTHASTPRIFDRASGEWRDGDALFLRCVAWRNLAENIGASLKKGTRVVAMGALKQRNYTTAEGEKRSLIELDIDEIGPSLRYQRAALTPSSQGGSSPSAGLGQGAQRGPSAASNPTPDVWATTPKPAADAWNTPGQDLDDTPF